MCPKLLYKIIGNKQYYRSEDFYPGAWVNVFSRPMFIFDCVGEETRKFMQNLHGTISYTDCDKVFHDAYFIY